MALCDVAECRELVGIEAAGRIGDGDAARHLAAIFEDRQSHAAHVGDEFEIVEGVAVGPNAAKRAAQLFGIGNGVGRDLGQPGGDRRLGGAYVPEGEQGLAAGNAVITKTPEDCPLAVIEISRYLEDAGLPPGAHQLLTGGREVGEALLRAEGLHMIAMTGSTAAGKRIHLELGGNDATIVCGDADVEATADALIAGRFTSGNGQICCAVKRVLVEKPIYRKLLEAVSARAKKLRAGDPMDPPTDVGPLINRRGAELHEVFGAAV